MVPEYLWGQVFEKVSPISFNYGQFLKVGAIVCLSEQVFREIRKTQWK
jgi:hypothetical protein